MDPVVAKMFDKMLKWMEDFDKRSVERWERSDKRFEDASVALQEREEDVDVEKSLFDFGN
jgi:hypothetical protein